jgi:hypothetical protein
VGVVWLGEMRFDERDLRMLLVGDAGDAHQFFCFAFSLLFFFIFYHSSNCLFQNQITDSKPIAPCKQCYTAMAAKAKGQRGITIDRHCAYFRQRTLS